LDSSYLTSVARSVEY